MYAKCDDCDFETRCRTARTNHEHRTGHKMSEYFEVSVQQMEIMGELKKEAD